MQYADTLFSGWDDASDDEIRQELRFRVEQGLVEISAKDTATVGKSTKLGSAQKKRMVSILIDSDVIASEPA